MNPGWRGKGEGGDMNFVRGMMEIGDNSGVESSIVDWFRLYPTARNSNNPLSAVYHIDKTK